MNKKHTSNICRAFLILTLIAILPMLGCTSFKSTIVHRRSDDSIRPQLKPRVSRGVPVKLKVPSHMEVTITEKFQVIPGYQKGSVAVPPQIVSLTGPGSRRLIDVQTNLEYTEKVFTVDFPRPISGSLVLGDTADGITFDGEQYFSKIRGSIDDDTLEDLNTVIGTEFPKLRTTLNTGVKSAQNLPDPVGDFSSLDIQERVIAYERFDINECGWEERMQTFIDTHVNNCKADSCGAVVEYHY